jgi:broad specificity phosphatase PhoE
MKNQTYLIHSGASIADADTQQWKHHHRSTVNPFDAPLSEAGKEQMENVAKNIEQIDVIYCSPMARSIESALILKEKFDVPVRVEYGLAESPILADFTGVVTPKFINGTFVKLVPNHIEFNGQDYYSLFDDELLPEALYAKYPQLDAKYTPLYLPQQIPFSEDDCQYGNRMIRVMNKLANQGKNVAFIGHKGVVTLAAVYLRKIQQGLSHGEFFRPINSVYFGSKPAYGLMVKFSGKELDIIE